MLVYFMYKFVEVVLVAGAEINKCLNSLIRVCRDFLSLACFNRLYSVISEQCKISNTVVNVGRLVDANQGFVKDGEQVPEQLQCCWLESISRYSHNVLFRTAYLFNNLKHHELISLS